MAIQKQKILSKKNIFDAKLFTVSELEIEFPNGIQVTHHTVERRSVVYIFPLTKKYELYCIKEYSYMTDEEVLMVPAGFIEDGENPLQAAKRELLEEAGITAGQWEAFATVELAKDVIQSKAYLFFAKELVMQKAHPEETEQIEVVSMPLTEAVEKVMQGEIRKAPVIAGILMLDKLRQKKRL